MVLVSPGENNLKYDDFTLVIQGPVDNPDRLDAIWTLPEYKEYFQNIIISTWTEHATDEFMERVNEFANVYVQDIKDIDPKIILPYNIGHQVLSTLGGLYPTKTKYAIKLRIDESYSNLWKIAEKFLEDDSKYVTGSSFLCPKSDGFFFEAPDHIIACKTDVLTKTFEEALSRLYAGTYERNESGDPAPEITFTKSHLHVMGEEPNVDRHDDLMCKYFDFVNDREMYPFVVRCNSGNMKLTQISQIDPSLEGISDLRTALNRRGVKW